MAHWTENLQVASFGGVIFRVDSVSESHGRRIARHALIGGPVRVQDLGLADQNLNVTGYIGDDLSEGANPYAQYKQLEAFVKSGTRGTFVHPNHGRIPNCLAISIRPTTQDKAGGLVSFRLSLTINPTSEYQLPQTPANDRLLQAADALQRGSLEFFSGTYLDETSSSLRSTIEDAGFQTPESPIENDSWFNKITEFGQQIKNVRGALFGGAQARLDQVLGSISGPLNTVNEATSIMADISFTVTRFRDAPTSLRGLQSMLNYYSSRPFFPLNGTTSYHRRARHNERVFNLTLSGLTASSIGRTLSNTPIRDTFDSRSDASTYVDSVEDSLHRATNEFLESGVTPTAMMDFQTALVDYSEEFLPQVAQVRTVESPTRNAAVVSHRYLRDSTQIRRVVEENNALTLFELPHEVEVRRV